LLRALINQCGISEAFDPDVAGAQPAKVEFNALWDTGATDCVITQAVIDTWGLSPIGRTEVTGVHGKAESDVYLVNISLPDSVDFVGIRVTKGELGDADILIGMNIITQGDFAVSSFSGITKFSFRVPSEDHIDFVEAIRRKNLVPQFQHGGTKANRTKRQKPASNKPTRNRQKK
jgi:hypothetical protein